MAKEESMELGGLILQSQLRALYFKNIHIQEMANEHGRLSVSFVPEKKVTKEDVLRCQGSRVEIGTLDGETVFSGIWTSICLSGGKDYTEIYAQAVTLSVQADEEKKTATFQNTEKTLKEIMEQGIGARALVEVDTDLVISEMLLQEKETDWAFNRRIANQYQKLLFVNSKASGCQIHVGAVPFGMKELGTVQDIRTLREVDKVREIQKSTSPKASVFEFEETVLTVYDLSIGVGYGVSYQGRRQTVTKSEIFSRQGMLLNRITLTNQEGIIPSASQSMGVTKQCRILTGTVTDRDKTNVKVDFATLGDVPRWMPYAHGGSNYFYSMPDIGDRVFVYYETGDSEKIVCLGSRHVHDSPDFIQYKDKMLTANNRMIQFSEKEVSLIGNRKEWDGLGGEQASIVFHDQKGIEITSTQDISLETTEAGKLTIQSVKDDYAGIEAIKEGFTQKYQEGRATYERDGGTVPDFDAQAYLASREFKKIKENVVQHIMAPFQVIGTVQELGGRIGGARTTEGEETLEEEAPEFSDGVVNIFALEKMVIQVGTTCLLFSEGVLQIKTNTYMQLGMDRSIAY